MNIFFGTDGWRALLDTDITSETVEIVGQAFADFIAHNSHKESPVVVIGYDTRRNSELFAEIFSEVLSGNNIQVLLSDRIIPTPVLSYATMQLGCNAGVMITASHNPPSYNGIKFKAHTGGPFSSEETHMVEQYLHASPIRKSKIYVKKVNLLPDYIEHIETLIDFDLIQKNGRKILIDSMGGAGLSLIQEILSKHGCQAHTIFSEPSETFNGRLPEPIEKNLLPLMNELKGSDFSFGVATDGDADRVGVCLDTGEWLSAQNTILLLVDYVKRVRKCIGGVVKTSSVSDKVKCNFESADMPVYEVQVGFKYIADVMVTKPIAFGGEESGGFGYGMHIPERDGVFSSLLLLEMLSKSPYSKLSDYLQDRQQTLGYIHYGRIDYHYEKPDKNDLLPWLYESNLKEVAGYPIRQTSTFLSSRGIINGIKFILGESCRWLLIRSSETENNIRFYAEGHNEEEVDILLQAGQDLLENLSEAKTLKKITI